MKNDSDGRSRYQEFTLPSLGTDGVLSVETPDNIALSMNLNALTEDTAPASADYLCIYSDEDAEHKRLPLTSFLSFPPVGISYQLFEVVEQSESVMYTWTKHGSAQWIMVLLVGGGGGGGAAGQDDSTTRHSGGGGGGGGGYERTPLLPSSLFRSSGSLRVGGGGTGGPGGIGYDTAGGGGQGGHLSTCGGLLTNVEVSANNGSGGLGVAVAGTQANGGNGGAQSSILGTNGGNGGNGDSNANSQSGSAGRWGAGGGGGSAGINTGGVQFNAGGGSRVYTYFDRFAAAGLNGTGASATDGAVAFDSYPMLSGSAGGGGGGGTDTGGFLGGAGGDGGYPGGGGGGGGVGTNGDGYAGLGGSGEDGVIALFQFF